MSDTKKYFMRINEKWLYGFEEPEYETNHFRSNSNPPAKAGVLLTDNWEAAKVIEGNRNLKSAFDKLYERLRFNGLELNKLEVEAVV